ncbi:MAG: ornithine cyclodeaminase family protein [Candidatus Hodarchaeota archaeon]
MGKNEILIVSEEEVTNLLSISDAIKIVEETFRTHDKGRTAMPNPACIHMNNESLFMAMPAYVATIGIVGVKWLAAFPENPKKYGIPSHLGLIVLNDEHTSLPMAVMGGNWITAARTAAVTAIGAKYLAKRDAKTVGIIGAGVQAATNLEALNEVLCIDLVKVTSLREKTRKHFAATMTEKFGLKVIPVNNSDEVVKGADIVVNATPANQPFLKEELAAQGLLFINLGTHQGCDDKFPKKADKIILDTLQGFTALGWGNFADLLRRGIVTTKDVYAEIGQIVSGRKIGRNSDYERILFFHGGMAVNDIAVAHEVYNRALENGIGRNIRIFS